MLFCKLGIHDYEITHEEDKDIYRCRREGCDRVIVMERKDIPKCGCGEKGCHK